MRSKALNYLWGKRHSGYRLVNEKGSISESESSSDSLEPQESDKHLLERRLLREKRESQRRKQKKKEHEASSKLLNTRDDSTTTEDDYY
jgi:hypothetical protein